MEGWRDLVTHKPGECTEVSIQVHIFYTDLSARSAQANQVKQQQKIKEHFLTTVSNTLV